LGENRGSRYRILIPNVLDLSFYAPNDYANFHRNRPKIATVGVMIDTQTDRQTDRCKWFYNLSHAVL